MQLEFIETIGGKVFRIDDVSDEAPMIELRFFNEFAEIPYAIRREAAKLSLAAAMEQINKADVTP